MFSLGIALALTRLILLDEILAYNKISPLP